MIRNQEDLLIFVLYYGSFLGVFYYLFIYKNHQMVEEEDYRDKITARFNKYEKLIKAFRSSNPLDIMLIECYLRACDIPFLTEMRHIAFNLPGVFIKDKNEASIFVFENDLPEFEIIYQDYLLPWKRPHDVFEKVRVVIEVFIFPRIFVMGCGYNNSFAVSDRKKHMNYYKK